MNKEMYEVVKNRKGFIAALDQSGGSSAKTLALYGIPQDEYSSEEEMFDLIHKMRERVFTSKVFTSDKILGAILFEKTMMSKVDNMFTADYLWEKKKIVSFLKVDKGLADLKNDVKLMKDIPNLEDTLKVAKEKHIFGTKMRSVIYDANEKGIKAIVKQQFEIAKVICKYGLVPIIEPEVDINSPHKEECEKILKKEVMAQLKKWDKDTKIMFKFTIPTISNLYYDLYDFECVLKIVALSGGYANDLACKLLSQNKYMIASFSRALLEGLSAKQTQAEFDKKLSDSINMIYEASIA